MVQQQTAALQAMAAAVQSLANTASRTAHISSRVSARGGSRGATGPQTFEPPKDEFELNGLRASAERKLQQILDEREKKEAKPPAKIPHRRYDYERKRYLDVGLEYPQWYRHLVEDNAELKANLKQHVADAMVKMEQYEKSSNRRYPCQVLNELIDRYNAWDKTVDKVTLRGPHRQYTFYQDGTVKDVSHKLVDPGIFWTTELERKPFDRSSQKKLLHV